MELKDMKDLIDIYDAKREIDGAVSFMIGAGQYTGGALGRMNKLYELIARNAAAFKKGAQDPEFNNILFNANLSSQERAEKLLGIKKQDKNDNNMSFELWLFAIKHLGQNFETAMRIYEQLSFGEKEILKKEYEAQV